MKENKHKEKDYIIIEDSDYLDLDVIDNHVISKRQFKKGELLAEARGLINTKGEGLELKNNKFLLITNLVKLIDKKDEGNCVLKRKEDKIFVYAFNEINEKE